MIQLLIEIDEELYKKTKDGYLSCIDALGVCEFVANGKPLIESDKEGVEPHECNTCKFGKNYENGYDATTMNDECGGCCSWNDKWQPTESEDKE